MHNLNEGWLVHRIRIYFPLVVRVEDNTLFTGTQDIIL